MVLNAVLFQENEFKHYFNSTGSEYRRLLSIFKSSTNDSHPYVIIRIVLANRRLRSLIVVLSKNNDNHQNYHFTGNTAIFNIEGTLLLEVRNNFIYHVYEWCDNLNFIQSHLNTNRTSEDGFMVAIGMRKDRNVGYRLYKANNILADQLVEFNKRSRLITKRSNAILKYWEMRHKHIFKQWKEQVANLPPTLFTLNNSYYTTQFIGFGFVPRPHIDNDVNSYSIAYCIDRQTGITGGNFIMNEYNVTIEMISKSIWLFNSDELHSLSTLSSKSVSIRNRMIGVLTCPRSLSYNYRNDTFREIDCQDKKIKK